MDNDLWPPLTINDVTVNESAGTATFTVTATGETALEVRVSYATSNGTAQAGSDFSTTTGTLIFEPGPPRTQTIAVPIRSDT